MQGHRIDGVKLDDERNARDASQRPHAKHMVHVGQRFVHDAGQAVDESVSDQTLVEDVQRAPASTRFQEADQVEVERDA